MDIAKSREAFENWAEGAGALPWGYLKKQCTTSGGYSVQIYQYMWNAWKASRESIEVEIPYASSALDYSVDVNVLEVTEVIEILRTAGIRIKGGSE